MNERNEYGYPVNVRNEEATRCSLCHCHLARGFGVLDGSSFVCLYGRTCVKNQQVRRDNELQRQMYYNVLEFTVKGDDAMARRMWSRNLLTFLNAEAC